ncbi:hypothetical protein HZS_1506 [Henneguya salminicola]|nr:hypothetical protein HZS_1506 [Henneguya salminicola]
MWPHLNPKKVTFGINNEEKIQGRVITMEFDSFFVINAYVPNSGEKLVKYGLYKIIISLEYRQKWNRQFCDYLKSLDEVKPVLLCGDLNVAHHPIDLTHPSKNLRSAGFTIEEREDFSQLLSSGFTDSFRHLYPEKIKSYTYWSYRSNARANNTGWRLDYFVISNRIKDKVIDCVPRNDVFGSDHCPVVLFLNN